MDDLEIKIRERKRGLLDISDGERLHRHRAERLSLVECDRPDPLLLGSLIEWERNLWIVRTPGLHLPVDNILGIELDPHHAVLLNQAINLFESIFLPRADAAEEQHATGVQIAHRLAHPKRGKPVGIEAPQRNRVIEGDVGPTLPKHGWSQQLRIYRAVT